MSDTAIYIDAKGDKLPVDLSLSMYQDAAEKNMSLKQFMAMKYPTDAEKHGTAYEQVLDQAGIYVRDNKAFGIRSSTVSDVLSPKNAATITREGIPASRLLVLHRLLPLPSLSRSSDCLVETTKTSFDFATFVNRLIR